MEKKLNEESESEGYEEAKEVANNEDEVKRKDVIIKTLADSITQYKQEIKALQSAKGKMECRECLECKVFDEKLIKTEKNFETERMSYLELIENLNEEIARMKHEKVINLATPIVDGKKATTSYTCEGGPIPLKKRREDKGKEAFIKGIEMPNFSLLTPRIRVAEDEDNKPEDQNITKNLFTELRIPPWFMAEDEKAKLLKLHGAAKGDRGTYYWVTNDNHLTIDDFSRVFENKFITDKLIDAWSYVVNREVDQIHIFPSNLWVNTLSLPEIRTKSVDKHD